MNRYWAILFLISGIAFAAPPVKFQTNAARAFSEAKQRKVPVLISFFGVWCPPCNEMEETVYESTGFLEKAKNFVLLKLDVDAVASFKLKDKYKVGGYPTIVFTTPKGDELYRVVGYRAPAEFMRVMGLVLSAGNRDFSAACQSKDAEDLWRCAVISQERGKKAAAEAAYKKLEPTLKAGTPRYLEARSFAVDNSATPDLKRHGLEGLMAEFPESPKAALWAYTYATSFEEGEKQEPKKDLLLKVLANFDKMMASSDKDELGVSQTDLLQIKAELLGRVGKKDEATAVWAQAAKEFETLAAQLPKNSHARGFTIERISCLEEAGDVAGALKLANEYRAKFPDDFTFHYQAAGLLNRAKRFPEAIPVAKKAYENSYGDNRIRAAILLLKLYATIPDKAQAKTLYDAVKKEINPDAKLEIRTHKYLKSLDKAWSAFG